MKTENQAEKEEAQPTYSLGPWKFGGANSWEVYQAFTGIPICKVSTSHMLLTGKNPIANAQLIAIAPAMASEITVLRECIAEALTMSENLRKATGDAIPAGICHALRAALLYPSAIAQATTSAEPQTQLLAG